LPTPPKPVFQRNQNQSAVGGSDITNPFGLCIEVKRQEALSLNTWWTQCITASREAGGRPIVLYRQNGKKWRALLEANFTYHCGQAHSPLRCEITKDDFDIFIRNWIKHHIMKNGFPNGSI